MRDCVHHCERLPHPHPYRPSHQANVAAAQHDLLASCRQGLAHGCLLVMRHVLADLDWNCAPAALLPALQAWVDGCLDALLDMADVVLPVVATPQVGTRGL